MLTEKDYCDYGLIVELEQLGMPIDIDFACGIENGQLVYPNPPNLYEAQKWLREKHEIQVSVLPFEDCDTDADGNIVGRWVSYGFALQYTTTAMWIVNKGHVYDFDTINAQDTYEEALSEGIKEAIKILKENETIH